MATTQEIFKEAEGRMQGASDALAREFAAVRTGRANAGLLEGIRVEYYNVLTPLNQVATISVPDPKTILIQAWEPPMLPKIEKVIQKSDLGLTPVNDGKVIRLNIPALTEDRRKQLAKVMENKPFRGKVKHTSDDTFGDAVELSWAMLPPATGAVAVTGFPTLTEGEQPGYGAGETVTASDDAAF